MRNFGKTGIGLGFLFFALALSGCGKPKLDSKTTLETLSALTAAQKDPSEAAYAQPNPNESLVDQANQIADQAASSNGDLEVLGKSCTPIASSRGKSSAAREWGLNGNQCPVEWRMSQDASDPNHLKRELHFSERTADAKKISDVDSLSLALEYDPHGSSSADVTMTIRGHSQSKGDLTLEMNGHESVTDSLDGSLELDATLTIGEKVAEIKLTQALSDGILSEEESINGETLDGDDAQTIRDALLSQIEMGAKSAAPSYPSVGSITQP